MMRVSAGVFWVWLLLGVTGSVHAAAPPPSDPQIRQILANRIDVEQQSVGIVVGVIDPEGRRIVAYGHAQQGDGRPLTGDSVFEIGSITKVFTALLLTDMVEHGEIRLDEPVAELLPAGTRVPQRDGRQITLADLATHTSGLPRMPDNFRPANPLNPYADYSIKQLYQFLASYELPRDPGVKWVYSNLGFGLLGLALARHAGTGYGTLVEQWICQPLGMHSTAAVTTPSMAQRLAIGHSADLITVPSWTLTEAMAGAGALRSTANDLLTFLAAAMGRTRSALTPAFEALLSVQRPTEAPFIAEALGWMVDTRGGGEIIWKDGGTGGYASFIGYDPASASAVVVLSNSNNSVDDLGLHLLDSRYPLSVPYGSPPEAKVSPGALDRYVGFYELAPNAIFTISREGDQLFAQLTGQPRVAIYPRSPGEFFLKVVAAQLSFETDKHGRVRALTLHQNGFDHAAPRISRAAARQAQHAFEQHLRSNAPSPGTKASLLRYIDSLERGQPNYQEMTPEMATLVRKQLPLIEGIIRKMGALQSLQFKGVNAAGMDTYDATFAHGRLEWAIGPLTVDGKVAERGFRILP
jgi:serine-type D-Ala-D-Ala carboxypeptidase/endopeptidase